MMDPSNAAAVAVALLRKACHARDPDEQAKRRPFFVWLASRIAHALVASEVSKEE